MRAQLWFAIFMLTFAVHVQASGFANFPQKYSSTRIKEINNVDYPHSAHRKNSAAYNLTLVPRFFEYLSYLKRKAEEASVEYNNNEHSRPSTLYTVEDIIFTVTSRLPSFVFPSCIWKQDSTTRRREINKIFRKAPISIRPHLLDVKQETHAWTKDSASKINKQYLSATLKSLDALRIQLEDILNQTHAIKPLDKSVDNGYMPQTQERLSHYNVVKKIEHEVAQLLKDSHRKYAQTIKSINNDFNDLAIISGKLRRPLESIRHDTLLNTDLAKSALDDVLRQGLHHLPQALSTKLAHYREHGNEYISESLREIVDDICRQLQLHVKSASPTFTKIWDKASIEIHQNPVNYEFWFDTLSEIRSAFQELGTTVLRTQKRTLRSLIKSYCTCGL
ncbi:hypothetical protein BDF20DRAFT_857733 [Mycotypha africana]|uniref:uncharacterized protein n=1 Tax=Mycotypha africana TaxID=64632 RepID=UPI002301782F|nr:uncharacterized protein BDF20DRAFT_857733 [Mycotypha africana]KAI8984061.1 hypothetical protein BDF20DRAFT_857733 [Mycotypha africana]